MIATDAGGRASPRPSLPVPQARALRVACGRPRRATAGLPSLASSPGRPGDGPGRIRLDRHRARNGSESRHVCSPPSQSFCSYLRERLRHEAQWELPVPVCRDAFLARPGGATGPAAPGSRRGARRCPCSAPGDARPRLRAGPGPVIRRTEPGGASPRYRCEITP